MSQTSSGSGELEVEGVFADRWEEVSAILNEYLEKIKAKVNGGGKLAESALSMPYEDIRRLAHEECAEYAVALSQYSYFLQQELNYHQSKFDWSESTLTYLSANYGSIEIVNDKFIKKDIKTAKLAYLYKSVKSLLQMSIMAKNMINTLSGLSYKVSNLSDTFLALQQSKRRL